MPVAPSGRTARNAVAGAAIVLAVSASIAAEPGLSPDTSAGRLPRIVIPVHYAIELALDPEHPEAAGSETIDIEVHQATARIVLNASHMGLTRATIDGGQRPTIALDRDQETATLTFPHPLAPGPHKLQIAFTAQIGKSRPGLYAVDYRTERGPRRVISTHLAPTDARRMFPCWDEPAFKASYALAVTIPRSLDAVANMPVAREEAAGPDRKKVAFAPTPKMSSYLVALTVGELEHVTADVDGVAVSVVATAGKREQGRFALESATILLRYFNDYFGIPYPLPKLDLVAVPDGYVSAMEHWGAVTFREDRLLLDPAGNAGTARSTIFTLIAHELAHQWFGNLVTMGWWNDLWLNEGFATWMAGKATEQFHPRWQAWLGGSDDKQAAMRLDARGPSHAVRQPVLSERDADDMFDDITYNKAAAVVRMLESYLGEAAFRDGLRKYLAERAYANASVADLWRALEAASGQPVAAIAESFIAQPGLPLVVAEVRCLVDEQRLRLRQEPFTIGQRAPKRRWQIPVLLARFDGSWQIESVLLQNASIELAAGRCGEPLKLNPGDVGYYRVAYDTAARAALTRSLAWVAPIDQLNLLADAWALVEAGRAPPRLYFELVAHVSDELDGAAWEPVIRMITRLRPDANERPGKAADAKARAVQAIDAWIRRPSQTR